MIALPADKANMFLPFDHIIHLLYMYNVGTLSNAMADNLSFTGGWAFF